MQQYISGEVIIYSAKCEEQKEFEWNLPEYLPGISRIVKTDVLAEKCIFGNDGKNAFIDVSVKVRILYVSDHEGKLKSAVFNQKAALSFKEPFEIKEDFTAVPSCFINGIHAKPVTSRKIAAAFSITGGVTVFRQEKLALFCEEENEGVCVLKSKVPVCSRITLADSDFEHTSGITMDSSKPPIGEIIYSAAVFSGIKANAGDGFADFEARFDIIVLYEISDSNAQTGTYTTLLCPITVKDTLTDSRITKNHMPFLYIDISSAEPSVSFDSFGENKELSFDIKYSVSGFLYCQEEKEIVSDAFYEYSDNSAQTTGIFLDCMKNTISRTERVSETARYDMSGMQEISECMARLLSVSFEQSEGKLFAAAKCKFEILGTNASGELICTDCPVTLHMPLGENQVNPAVSVPDIILTINSCSAEISKGSLVCTAEISAQGVVTERSEFGVVSSIDAEETGKNNKCPHEIVICYPAKNDALWDIAKKYKRSPEKIKLFNGIENDDISSERFLIIP